MCVGHRLHASERAMQIRPGGEAFFGVVDGGLERPSEAKLPEALGSHAPAVGAAGNGDGVDAIVGHSSVTERGVALNGGGLCRAPAGIQAIELTRLGVVEQEKEVASKATDEGIDDLEGGVGGDGGVDCIAAGFEHVKAGLGGEIVWRGDDTMTSHCNGTMLGILGHDASSGYTVLLCMLTARAATVFGGLGLI